MAAIGESLREARLALNLSLEQAAQDTRISIRFLEALEEEDFKALPAPVYVRGFLRSYANYLGLDPLPLVERLWLDEEGGPRRRTTDPFQPTRGVQPLPVSVLVEREEGEPGAGYAEEEWDGSTDEWDEGTRAYAAPATARPSRIPGMLDEREGDGSGVTRMAMIVAGVAVAIVVFLGVLLVLGGGSDGNGELAPIVDPTETPTLASGTVIEVRSPTVEGTPGEETATVAGGATTATAAATATEGTATPTATPGSGGPAPTSPAPAATPTPSPSPTATPTPPPPTPTFTAVPTPTVIPHPYEFNECKQTNDECPDGSIVYCAPNGWFVDVPGVPPDGNWPAEWPRVAFTTISQAKTACG